MPTVNQTILKIMREKDRGILTGVTSMRSILRELQRQVLGELGQAATGSWDSYHLKRMLGAIERQVADFGRSAETGLSIHLDTSWKQGITMVDSPLAVSGIYTGFNVSTSSLDALKDFAFHKVKNISQVAFDRIKSELTLGVLGGKTPQEVAKVIGRNLKDPSIFATIDARAEAITKTEMGRVFSKATQVRMEEAGEQVDGLMKEWHHAGHPKVARPAHLAAHGQRVPVNEPFLIGNISMMFPRDPAAPASEVIHCGCDHVPWHERWERKRDKKAA